MPKVRDIPDDIPRRHGMPKRRDKTRCPFCNEKLGRRVTRSSRPRYSCEACKAQREKDMSAPCCSKADIWRSGQVFKCFTCGKPVG